MTRVLLLGLMATLATSPPAYSVRAEAPTSEVGAHQSAELAAFFNVYDKAQLELSPTSKTVRGIIDEDYGRWGNFSDFGAQRRQSLDRTTLISMRARFDRARPHSSNFGDL